MYLIYLSIAWTAGTFIGSRLPVSPVCFLFGLAPLPFLLLRRHRRSLVLLSLCLAAFIGGAARYQATRPVLDSGALRYYNGRTVQLKGLVSAAPDVRDKAAQLRLSTCELSSGGEWTAVSGTALVTVPIYPEHEYGDVLLLTGKLEEPTSLDDFDYRGYLAQRGIYSTMAFPRVTVLDRGKGLPPMAIIHALRGRLAGVLARVLPEPQASLAQGIALGLRGNIPGDVRDDFRETGATHVLAISGANLSIVAGILVGLGLWLFGRRRYIYVWLALGMVWLYVLLTGVQPPVVRAAIMASLFLAAEALGRQRSASTALAFAAAAMVAVTPDVLWDATFQMSFLATAGLVFLSPPAQAAGRWAVAALVPGGTAAFSAGTMFADGVAVTLAATVTVWPLVAHYFGIVALAGPLATLLLLPALPAVITLALLAGAVGLVAVPAAQILGWAAWLFLSYMLLVVRVLAGLPLSLTATDTVQPPLILAYYLLLAGSVWLGYRWKTLKALAPRAAGGLTLRIKWVLPPLAVVAALAWAGAATMPDGNLHVTFLDVGQGDAILIQKGRQQVLVDGGPGSRAVVAGLGKAMPFWDRTLDLVVLTHPDADHLAGLTEVLRRYRVERVLCPDSGPESAAYDGFLRLVAEKAVTRTGARAGQRIEFGGGVVIEVLSAGANAASDREADPDNGGTVLRASLGDVSFLLTADIRSEAEFELVSNRAYLRSDVLKVAHHGSGTSTTDEFLAVVRPVAAVVSVGDGNRFGHPAPDTLQRLARIVPGERVLRTDRDGTIEFTTDGVRLWVEREKR